MAHQRRLLWRNFVTPVSVVLTAIAVAAWVVAVLVGIDDPDDVLGWPPMVFGGAAVLPTAWLVLEPLVAKETLPNPVIAAIIRSITAPLLPTLAIFVTGVVLLLVPGVATRMVAEGAYLFNTQDGTPATFLLALGPISNLIMAMLIGLGIAVVIVLPLLAFLKPRVAMEANAYDTGESAAKANTAAIRALSIIILLTFLCPAMIIFGGQYGWGWMRVLGWVLIPIGVVAVVIVVRTQRPAAGAEKWFPASAAENNRRAADGDADHPEAAPTDGPAKG